MSKYRLTLGDWSDDGHGKTEVYVVEIPDRIDRETLKDNFNKNVDLIGFNPTELARDYEDSTISQHQIDALVANDFDMEQAVTQYSDYPIYPDEDGDGGHIAGPDGMVAILMHFIGHGIEDFSFSIVSDDIPELFGYWQSGVITSQSVGYGLFY